MANQSFTTVLTVDKSPQEVFEAINNVRGWWSENIEGNTMKLNSQFDYHYRDVHRCKIKIIESVPSKKIVWLVIDNYFKFTKDKSEWIDTKVIFKISEKGDKTEVLFTHQGLVPQYECYDVCNEAWGHFIRESLRALITTGKGQPSPRGLDKNSFDAQMVERRKLDQSSTQTTK